MIEEDLVRDLLRMKGGFLYHREGQELEFKEQWNFAGLADYFRDFAAFANNRGGYLVFGVKDSPRVPIGLSDSSQDQLHKLDPEQITGFLLDTFSSAINWEIAVLEVDGKWFAIFKIHEAPVKPIIARKDEGRDQTIKNGEIYYRYGGRTQKIQFAELEAIINSRIEQNNQHWLDLMSKIGRAGPENAAILDTEKSLIEKGGSKVLVLDEGLANKIKFIKEGEFNEKTGATTLKLVGDVVPIDRVEVIKKVKEHLTKSYPLAALELVEEVRKIIPAVKQGQVWDAIRDNDMKNNLSYSAYNFRCKAHEDRFKESGCVPAATPSIYNHNAIDFIVNIIRGDS